MRRCGIVLVLAFWVSGCGGDACRCHGTVPGGVLDVACGETACLDGNGYLCTGQNQATATPEACSASTVDAGIGADGGCVPNCAGQSCGSDGCGGSCGSCAAGQQCSGGVCVADCTPDCAGRTCGDDGCGGSCGSCGSGNYCHLGQCKANDWCLGYTNCGSACCPGAPFQYRDSYGGCGCRAECIPAGTFDYACFDDSDCCSDSKCSIMPGYDSGWCTGGCEGKSCTASGTTSGCCSSDPYCSPTGGCMGAPEGNGEPCADDAACDTGLTCVAGKCQAPCTPDCTGKACGDDGCGGSCGTCGGGVCVSGQCCTPDCSGKTCGDDGCGGSCGSCGSGACVSGQCCVPDCTGKACGDDGCGGSCGSCDVGELCSSGSCVADPSYCDPVTDTGCSSPNECILLSTEHTTCALAGTGTQGSYCSATVTCAGGYGCFAGSCRKICDLATGAGCLSGSTCNGVTGWVTYGACT